MLRFRNILPRRKFWLKIWIAQFIDYKDKTISYFTAQCISKCVMAFVNECVVATALMFINCKTGGDLFISTMETRHSECKRFANKGFIYDVTLHVLGNHVTPFTHIPYLFGKCKPKLKAISDDTSVLVSRAWVSWAPPMSVI